MIVNIRFSNFVPEPPPPAPTGDPVGYHTVPTATPVPVYLSAVTTDTSGTQTVTNNGTVTQSATVPF